MSGKRRGSLKGYEGANLAFFLVFMVALGGFVWFYFTSFRSPNAPPPGDLAEGGGILSEVVEKESDMCVFTLGTQIVGSRRRYQGPQDIPVTDDGFVRGLFEIPGVAEVVLERKMVILQKFPSARWEKIQERARVVISRHLHAHQ
ncbi:MAG: NifU N-terminal domain-containing protein [Acidobacteria bacterium]|nr:NifU N-terminal domain-containing protein [Acidobacteriota bacterium]